MASPFVVTGAKATDHSKQVFSDQFYNLYSHLRLRQRTFHLASSPAKAGREREKSLHVLLAFTLISSVSPRKLQTLATYHQHRAMLPNIPKMYQVLERECDCVKGCLDLLILVYIIFNT